MNTYIQTLSEVSISNKYLRWYISICERAQLRASTRKEAKALLGYTELHHILPKSFKLGGDKDSVNYVFLSAREHFICHLLLCKFSIGSNLSKMIFAANRQSTDGKHTSKSYEWLKRQHSLIYKTEYAQTFILRGINHPMYGEKQSEESKLKNRNTQLGRKSPVSPENIDKHRQRMLETNPFKGKTHTEETRKRMSDAKKKLRAENPEISCKPCTDGTNIFPSRNAAAEYYNVTLTTLNNWFKNNTKTKRYSMPVTDGINIFPTRKEAAEFYDVTTTTICDWLKGKSKKKKHPPLREIEGTEYQSPQFFDYSSSSTSGSMPSALQ